MMTNIGNCIVLIGLILSALFIIMGVIAIIYEGIKNLREESWKRDFHKTLVPIIKDGQMIGYKEVFMKIGD